MTAAGYGRISAGKESGTSVISIATQLLSEPVDSIFDWIRHDPQAVSIVPEWLREFVADVLAPEADVPQHVVV
jgi:hypothetical protein